MKVKETLLLDVANLLINENISTHSLGFHQ